MERTRTLGNSCQRRNIHTATRTRKGYSYTGCREGVHSRVGNGMSVHHAPLIPVLGRRANLLFGRPNAISGNPADSSGDSDSFDTSTPLVRSVRACVMAGNALSLTRAGWPSFDLSLIAAFKHAFTSSSPYFSNKVWRISNASRFLS